MKYFDTKKDSLEEAISKAINEKPEQLKEARYEIKFGPNEYGQDDEDDYINKTLKNPKWWTCNMNLDDKNLINDLKKIKKGINPSIKFDCSSFPDDEMKKLEKELG